MLGGCIACAGAAAATVAACNRTITDTDASVAQDSSGNDAPGPDAGSTCGGIDLGLVSDFAMDSLTLVAAAMVIVGRDASGLWAMSTQCAHLLGTVAPTLMGNELRCTAAPVAEHGATYDKDGRNTQWVAAGAARADQSLVNLKLTLVAGAAPRVCVDPARSVRVGTRVAV